jgi:hypothetical protein
VIASIAVAAEIVEYAAGLSLLAPGQRGGLRLRSDDRLADRKCSDRNGGREAGQWELNVQQRFGQPQSIDAKAQ